MKFNTMVRTALAAATSLAISLGLSACSRDYTAAYVYATSASTGTISAFGVDYQSGVLTQISGSPFPSQLTNPTTVVAAPNQKYLYVIGGTQNAEVEEFGIGTDGKLYGANTYNITGTYPTAASIDTTGTFLYVTYQYQKLYTPASPGPGGVTIFPISQTDGTLGTPVNVNLGIDPVAIAVSGSDLRAGCGDHVECDLHGTLWVGQAECVCVRGGPGSVAQRDGSGLCAEHVDRRADHGGGHDLHNGDAFNLHGLPCRCDAERDCD